MSPESLQSFREKTPISIIIPVYNEKDAIADTLSDLLQVLKKLPVGSEAIFVDDHSTDNSAHLLESAIAGIVSAQKSGSEESPSIRMLAHTRNRGYGASLKTGISEASNQLIAITDADGTYPVNKLPGLLQAVHKGARMAVGVRPLSHQPFIRRPAKWFLNRFSSWLSDTKIPDINSGLRVFYREDALKYEKFLPNAFSFTTTITMLLSCEGHEIAWQPIRYGKRVGKSKIKPLQDLYTFTLLILRLSMAFNPLRIFIPVSGALIFLSIIFLISRLIMDEPVGVATTIVLFVAGIQILFTGLIADLINRKI